MAAATQLISALEPALNDFRDALGVGNVLEGDSVEGHVDPYSFSGSETIKPSAVVMPANTSEVQAVVRIAGRHHLHLWTVSTGKNYGYGGASPRSQGSVVVDLSRMNAVLNVDETCGTALLEPGVTFLAFADHLRQRGSRLSPSVPDIGWGSVVGNALERGFGYTSYGDHSAMVCGLEVVMADGQILRTGMGAKANSTTWQCYKGGFGPSLDGLFFQSNFGIVTKMGIWLAPIPEQSTACMLKLSREEDLAAAVDALRPLLQEGTIQSNVVIGNAAVIASMITSHDKWTDDPSPLGNDVIERITQALHLGFWNVRFALYGRKEIVAAQFEAVSRATSGIEGAVLESRTYPGTVLASDVHPADHAQLGIPSISNVRMAEWRGGDAAHTDISLVCQPTGQDALTYTRLIRRNVQAHGFDYTGGITLFPRHAIALAVVSFDKSSLQDRQAVSNLFPTVISEASASGAAPYRSHLAFMDFIASQYDANDHAHQRLAEKLKNCMDPSAIFSPGKQGIWGSAPPAR